MYLRNTTLILGGLLVGAFLLFTMGLKGGTVMDKADTFLGSLKGRAANFIEAEEIIKIASPGTAWCFEPNAEGVCSWSEVFTKPAGEKVFIDLHTPIHSGLPDGAVTRNFARLTYDASVSGELICPSKRGSLVIYESDDAIAETDPKREIFRKASRVEQDDFDFSFIKPRDAAMCYRVSRVTIPLLGSQYRLHAYIGTTHLDSPMRFFAYSSDTPMKLRTWRTYRRSG
ncbi:MAG: hypothetical protein AAF360_08400 [Pseudomonadota bacterium]